MTGLKMGLRSNYRTRSAVWDLNLSETKTFQNLKGWRRDSIPGRFMTKCFKMSVTGVILSVARLLCFVHFRSRFYGTGWRATVKKNKKLFVLTFFLRNDVQSQNIEQNRVHSGSIPLLCYFFLTCHHYINLFMTLSRVFPSFSVTPLPSSSFWLL